MFDSLLLLPHRRQLLRDGVLLPLGARAYDTLEALFNERHRVVSKQELMERIWSGLVVEENNLATQVSTLRKLLGPNVIQTIPGRGYRFVAEVVVIGDDISAAPPSTKPRPAEPDRSPSLIGREGDLSDAQAVLRDHRQLTLLGVGGVGKTTLAHALEHHWPDTVRLDGTTTTKPARWISLASATNAQGLAALLADSLPPHSNAALLHASQGPIDWLALVSAVWPQTSQDTCLLVLDNAEHLAAEVAALVMALRVAAPALHVLVTSQVPLHMPSEHCLKLGPLQVPTAASELAPARETAAMRLLEAAAQENDATFSITPSNLAPAIQICRALEGVPLALRLAAARFRSFGVVGVATALDQRLQVFGTPAHQARSGSTSAADEQRHRTLRATLDWSYGLLSAREQAVLCQLAVGRGPISLSLATRLALAGFQQEAVPESLEYEALDCVASLVERSLVELVPSPSSHANGALGGEQQDLSTTTYRLPDTVRLYALAQLDAINGLRTVCQHHAHAMAALMQRTGEGYWTEPDTSWLAQHSPEADQLRAALDWAGAADASLAAQMLADSTFLFLQLGHAADARRRWLALEGPRLADADAPLRAAHALAGCRLHWGIDTPRMLALAERALGLARSIGDTRLQYLALRCALGSGQHTPAAGEALLADMQQLEDPDWPPRLRAQRLLAQIDHFALAGHDTPETIAQLAFARTALRTLAQDAGLDSHRALARIGLADSALLNGTPDIAAQRCRNLLEGKATLYGNQRLQVFVTLAAAQLAQAQTAEARATLHEFALLCRRRDWEWFDRHADLFTWLAAQEGEASLARELQAYADAAAAKAGGRAGPSWLRLHAQVFAAVAALPPAAPIAEPPTQPIEICQALMLGDPD